MQYSIVNYKVIQKRELPDGVPARRSLSEGVAEKFIEWAKSEKLSFWK